MSSGSSLSSLDSRARFDAILEPTVPLSRHIFKAPTRFYKTGVVFLAYLNGLQEHFVMLGGQQSARSLVHLAELFRRFIEGAGDNALVMCHPGYSDATLAAFWSAVRTTFTGSMTPICSMSP